MQYCFAADRTLGKLAKWLRILGFDTIFESEVSGKWFYEHLEQERILLTRTGVVRKRIDTCRLVFIEANELSEQLVQVIDTLAISLDDIRLFSRCIDCNTPIIDTTKETVFGRVPDYIWETHENFRMCRQCHRIFWRGSHTQRSTEIIEKLFEKDRARYRKYLS